MERMTEAKQATESERTAETGRVAEMKKAADEARTFGYEKLMQDCTLCPRACHADRLSGQRGYCGQTAQITAARAALGVRGAINLALAFAINKSPVSGDIHTPGGICFYCSKLQGKL